MKNRIPSPTSTRSHATQAGADDAAASASSIVTSATPTQGHQSLDRSDTSDSPRAHHRRRKSLRRGVATSPTTSPRAYASSSTSTSALHHHAFPSASSSNRDRLRAGGSSARNQGGNVDAGWMSTPMMMASRAPSSTDTADFSVFDSDRPLFGTSPAALNGPLFTSSLISGSLGPSIMMTSSPPPISPPASPQSSPSPLSLPVAHDNDDQDPAIIPPSATSAQATNHCNCPSRRDMVPFWIREMDPRFGLELHLADSDFRPRYFC